MSFELYPTPTPVVTGQRIPFVSAKKFPGVKTLAGLPLNCPDYSGSDIVTSYWGYDCRNLYLAVETSWPADNSSERAWRHGDGFFLTASPHICRDPVRHYTSLGLGGSEKHPQKLVISASGRYLGKSAEEIVYRQVRNGAGTLYTAVIPWKLLPPLLPLSRQSLGLNITFIRKTESKRQIFQLIEDTDYDTELTLDRRIKAMRLDDADLSQPQAQTRLYRARIYGSDSLELNLGLFSPVGGPAELNMLIRHQSKALEKYCSAMELAAGSHRWTMKWSPQRPLPSGLYSLLIEGKGGGKTFHDEQSFFIANPEEIQLLRQDLEAFELDFEYPDKGTVQTALHRLDWLETELQAPPWDLPDLLPTLMTDAQAMLQEITAGNNPLASKRGLVRRAFRSRLDASLQPYSLVLPKAYSEDKKWPLLMFLHGSGVDDFQTGANPNLHKLAERLGIVVLIPNGRNNHGFYLDDCETDILEALEAAKTSLSVSWSDIFLGGFSMGGFGAWHTGLRYPRLFAGLAILSGLPHTPDWIPRENRFLAAEHPEAAKSLPIFVTHGTQDASLPVEATRTAVSNLKRQGADITFKEFNAGHSNYDWAGELSSWLKAQLKK